MRKSFRLAFSAILVAFSVICMLSTSFLSVLEYAMPLLSGVILLPILIEFGFKQAILAYVCTGVLAAILPHDLQALVLFWCLFGYYPILKGKLERLHRPILEWIAKFSCFLLAITVSLLLLVFVFRLDGVLEELAAPWFWVLYAVLALLGFLVYDRALSVAATQYCSRFRGKFFKGLFH